MNPSLQKTLDKISKSKCGVTVNYFSRGFRLSARIFDLRQKGYKILTIREDIPNGFIARYVLVSRLNK